MALPISAAMQGRSRLHTSRKKSCATFNEWLCGAIPCLSARAVMPRGHPSFLPSPRSSHRLRQEAAEASTHSRPARSATSRARPRWSGLPAWPSSGSASRPRSSRWSGTRRPGDRLRPAPSWCRASPSTAARCRRRRIAGATLRARTNLCLSFRLGIGIIGRIRKRTSPAPGIDTRASATASTTCCPSCEYW